MLSDQKEKTNSDMGESGALAWVGQRPSIFMRNTHDDA
jgi:hypothetical protein